MPSFDIIKTAKPEKTYRVSSVLSAFDLDIEKVKEHFKGSIDIEGKNWNIGLIVGGSGTGKSTIAKEIFGDYFMGWYYKWGVGLPYRNNTIPNEKRLEACS